MALTATAGAADADSFVTLAAFKAYCAAKGYSLSGKNDTTDLEPAIRRGTTYVGQSFAWKGLKTNGRDQSLAWPRYGVTDAEGLDVPSDVIPSEIESATCEAAFYELGNPNGLFPSVALSERVKSERVGPLSVEYAPTYGVTDAKPVLTILAALVKGLTEATANALVGSSVRA